MVVHMSVKHYTKTPWSLSTFKYSSIILHIRKGFKSWEFQYITHSSNIYPSEPSIEKLFYLFFLLKALPVFIHSSYSKSSSTNSA